MRLSEQSLSITGITLSRTGFGAWAIGGDGWRYGWGPQDDAASVAAVQHAVDGGVNWIDTAAVYGLGHSEEVIGKALATLPAHARPYVFTKCGLVWDPSDPTAAPHRIMKPASVRRELEDSLRRLNVDQIDLYQVHYPDTGESLDWGGAAGTVSPNATPIEEYWQVMADLKAEGKVRAIGLSNHSVAELERAERIAHVDAIQPAFSAVNRGAAAEIAWAKAHGTGVIAYSPMQSGLLTGAFSAERAAALPADDWRTGHPDFTTGLAANLQLADALRPVADRHGVGVGAVAVAWVLAWPGVSGAIVGARTPQQVDGWLPAAGLELTAQDLAEIATAIERTGAGTGPSRA
ncbi:aldo/keto reductase [Kitasatospora sp. NPDC101801]|uniref:aldo/keto reductase n=1 Tax=Kitasatospora sp. NPDC101801 TaxID=3364103 RepID=UPI00382896E4